MRQSTLEKRREAPTPMMAVVFVWVVETGIPNTEDKNKQIAAVTSAEKPWYFSSFTISIPTDLMIFIPPTEVPIPMVKEQRTITQSGIEKPLPVFSARLL